ncbi:MAG: MASE3 domain-containing protein [Neobacillus sp.]
MKPMTETKFLVYTVCAILILLLVRIFHPQLSNIYNPANYTGIHTFLEILCISISAVIFLYGLKNFQANRSNRMLLLVFTFLTVGMIDLLHTLSFKGMPYFITESSVAKATWFWIAARTIQSILMLMIILTPERKLKKDYRALTIFGSLVFSGIIGFLVFTYEMQLPLLVIEGKGTTLLKNSMEYVISFILFISLMFSLYHYYLKKSEQDLNVALGIVFILLMELIFTIYQSVLDLDNFLGHIFKVYGFYFILKGYYFSAITSETEENSEEEDVRIVM